MKKRTSSSLITIESELNNKPTVVNESKQLLKIASPLIISQLTLMSMGLTDVLIAGWAGTTELAGMMLGNSIVNIVIFLFFGVGIAAQPLVGRYFGEGSPLKIRRQIHQLLWASLFSGLIAALCLLSLYVVLGLLNYDQQMKSVAKNFVLVMIGSGIAFPILGAVRGSLDGMKQSNKMIPINLAAFLTNIPLDYALVLGEWGFPKLGAMGCAIATVTIHWCMIFAGIMILKNHGQNRQLRLFQQFIKPNIEAIKQVFRLGLPIGISIIAEMGFFALIGIMIAFLGEVVAAAHAIAIGLAGFFYMIYLGIGQAITVRSSNLIGANQSGYAWFSCKTGIALGLLMAIPPMLLIYFYRQPVAQFFNSDPAVIYTASVLLLWAVLFQVGDALQAVILCALRAYHIALSAVRYQAISFWLIAFPLGYLLMKYEWLPFATDAAAYWLAMNIGLTLAGILLWFKLRRVAHQTLT